MSKPRVVSLPHNHVCENLVSLLEGLLARAKAGDIVALGTVSQDKTGRATYHIEFGAHPGATNTDTLLGAFARAQLALAVMTEQRSEDE